MKLKEWSDLKFSLGSIASLWKSKITSLDALQTLAPGSTLAALDIESTSEHLREIGLAFQRIDRKLPKFNEGAGTRSFYNQHGINAHTVQVRGRISRKLERNTPPFGDVQLVNPEEVHQIVTSLLSDQNKSLILVGFDLHSEFLWMARECPSLSSLFTAWIDLQDIAYELSDEPSDKRPSLSDTVRALEIKDWFSQKHRAAHDAVRCLAVLSGLVTSRSCNIPDHSPKVQLFSRLPSPDHPRAFGVRITATDGGMLPRLPTASAVSVYFADYQPKAVALNRSGFLKNGGVRVWWMSFVDLQSMNHCVAQLDGSSLDGRLLTVEASGSHSNFSSPSSSLDAPLIDAVAQLGRPTAKYGGNIVST